MAISTTYNPSALSARTGQGSAIGNREDLSGLVAMLEAKDTPLLTIASNVKATATYHEWLVDKLEDPTNDAVNEGADVTSFSDAFSKVARLGNRTQHFRRDWRVSKEQEIVNSAGKQDVARAISKKLIELKRDVEKRFLSDEDSATENGTTANAARGLGDWLDSAGPSDVAADFRTPSGSILAAAPTEITLNDVIASIFTINGSMNNLTLLAGTTLRKRVSEFTRTDNNASETVYNSVQYTDTKKVTLAVNIFDSDFGLLNIINGNPKCMPAATRGYVVNPAYVAVATLMPTGTVRLEDQGGGPRGYVDCMETLVVRDPRAHGKIAY
jgi:hypothetical protein